MIERLSEDAGLRQQVRNALLRARLRAHAQGREGEDAQPLRELLRVPGAGARSCCKPQSSHRYLAMRRGWMEEELVLTLGGALRRRRHRRSAARRAGRASFEAAACPPAGAAFAGAPLLKRAARLALRAHVAPSIDTEVHKALREIADAAAITVFAENVRKLLLAAPFGPKSVLGVDPGLRTGCKLAVVDETGRTSGRG